MEDTKCPKCGGTDIKDDLGIKVQDLVPGKSFDTSVESPKHFYDDCGARWKKDEVK